MDPDIPCSSTGHRERGSALAVALIGLALFAVIGFWIGLSAASEVEISDNYEAELRARFASLAGISHARDALRGVNFDEILRGPDGTTDASAAYLARARTAAFRNPLTWLQARGIELSAPSPELAGLRDDGVIHSGGSGPGLATATVPITGLPLPGGARYFVKASDNNGEPSEVSGDSADNPFTDGDGTILVRSMGCAGTLRERLGSVVRKNAVIVTEARLRRRSTFDLEAPLVIQGTRIVPDDGAILSGTGFRIAGGPGRPGIGVVDADPSDGVSPLEELLRSLDPAASDLVTGGAVATPSIADVAAVLSSNAEKSLRLEGAWLWDFSHVWAPRISDSSLAGGAPQGRETPLNLGAYDPALPSGDPAQDPRVTFVDGDLAVTGELRGAGLLVVTGNLSVSGKFEYYGLILVAGGGRLTTSGGGLVLIGAVQVSSLRAGSAGVVWGEVGLHIGGATTLVYDASAVAMAIALIPPAQVGIREVTRSMDP